MTPHNHKHWLYCLGPAVAMLLGWGLRGFIGGGPLGAMIPGAMVALLLCLILGMDRRTSALLAAFGAIGIGFGGQMTYGQTIGLIVQHETFFRGFVGLSLKGGIWGLLGGAVLGLGFIRKEIQRKDIVVGLVLFLVGLVIGWQLINVPKLIYLSNPHDKPREEIWAGLLFGVVALLGYLGFKGKAGLPLHFAMWGALGGAIGFGGGGLWMCAGKALPELKQMVSWWKLMELTFGFCFGLALGHAAWQKRETILAAQATPHPAPDCQLAVGASVVSVLVLGLAVLGLEASIDIVCTYTFLGVALLILALYVESLAWQIGLTVTTCAFVYDLTEKFFEQRDLGDSPAKWGMAALTAVIFGWLAARRQRAAGTIVGWAFLLLMWSAVVVSYLKSMQHPRLTFAQGSVELVFTLSAVLLTWMVSRKIHATESSDAAPGHRLH